MLEDLAIIVLNYNSYNDTYKCVSQLLSFSADFRIVIVDNNSSDASYEQLKNCFENIHQVTLLKCDKNGGYSYGNNYGIKFAKKSFNSKFIAILNPDVIIPDCNIFLKMKNILLSSDEYAMIGGMAITNNKFEPNRSAWPIPNNFDVFWERSLLNPRRKYNYYEMVTPNIASVDCVAGCFFIIKTDYFYKVGLFDEGVFLYNEENILGIKLKHLGYKTLVATDCFYYHNHGEEKDKAISLYKKIAFLRVRYKSRKYLIENYYKKILIFPLFLVESVNAIQIFVGHVKGRILKLFNN